MCFSATASFAAGVILLGSGIATIKRVKEPRFYLFASIPFLFGVQQISEGFLWLSFQNDLFLSWRNGAMYTFLVFAQIVWPALVPFSIMRMETNEKRKRILFYFTLIGFGVAAFLTYALFFFPVSASVREFHIHYSLKSQQHLLMNSSVFYFLATVVSSFVSSVKKMPIFGTVILISLIVTEIFYHEYVISVWCFFAAVLSAIIYFILGYSNERV